MFNRLGKFLKVHIGGLVLGVILKLLHSSIRWEYIDNSQLSQKEENSAVIFSFWHNRIAMMPGIYRRLVQSSARRCYALISLHGDGRLIADAIKFFGLRSVGGSSTKGGRAAVHRLVAVSKRGFDLAITPDGPRGPKYHCKGGVIAIAQMAERRVFPLGVAVDRFWRLGSWDRMIIPKPFARGIVIVGEPVMIRKDGVRGTLRTELEEQMHEVTKRADTFWDSV